MPTTARYRPDIDGLRAIAVLAVVLFHAGVPGFSGGFVGVDIFFVISGFLISGIILREFDEQSFSYSRFYERRVRRILPALFVMLIASSVLAYLLLYPPDARAFGEDLASVVLFGSNIRFWRTITYFAPQAAASPLVHTWSLGIEEQFYITFPFIFAWLLRRHRRASNRIVAIAIAGSFVLCAAYSELRSPQAAFFLLPARAWELLLGTTLAKRRLGLVYGGASVGLMGAVADAALAANAEVIGVIPRALDKREIAHRRLTELHIVDSMHTRKASLTLSGTRTRASSISF